ncbi:MAG: HAD family hydrolase [Planctomycetota bacterium]|nr:MAG: HAD family hydrolase [Planctomycetota bacterium]
MPSKAIFLDRDDTLIEDPGYINHPDQVKLLDGVTEALAELKAMGYKLIVVSNQSAVARGIVSEKVLGQIHDRLKQLLAEKGTSLDRIYYCPYHPDGVIPKYRKESDWRKPNPGMLLTAADELNLDLGQSWVVGNSDSDIQAGLRAGCKTILIDHPSHYKRPESGKSNPDYRAVNMKEAVNIIKKHLRSSGDHTIQTQPAPPEPGTISSNHNTSTDKTERLLNNILEQLRAMRRNEMFGEFSAMRLMAGVVQVIALFCLLISIWFLMSPNRQDNSVLIALGFTIVLQLMSLTLYVMQRKK